jgi:hypothetical protein
MAYLVTADLTTHIYSEIITEIVRGDDSLSVKAINAGICEAKSYLNKYDLTLLFADDFADENLKGKVKDLACWHLIKLCNPNIELALFRTAYEDAIKYFDKVTKGFVDPDGWPYKPDDPLTKFPEGSSVTSSSTRKRCQHW